MALGTADEKDAFNYGNYLGHEDGYDDTAPVMSFLPNHLGIYDLGGNAWEWCDGWFADDHKQRVLRGGAISISTATPLQLGVATELNYRSMPDKDNDRRVPGFRVVLVPASDLGTRLLPEAQPRRRPTKLELRRHVLPLAGAGSEDG